MSEPPEVMDALVDVRGAVEHGFIQAQRRTAKRFDDLGFRMNRRFDDLDFKFSQRFESLEELIRSSIGRHKRS